MKIQPTLALLALLAVPLSGCLGEEAGSTDATNTPEDSGESSIDLTPVVEVVPADFTGHIQYYTCLSASTGCQLLVHSMENGQRFPVPQGSTLTDLDLTLTWDAATPVAEAMSLRVEIVTPLGYIKAARAEGTSPLTLTDVDVHAEGVATSILVWAIPAPSMAGQSVVYDQTFKVEGTVTVETSPDGGPGEDAPCTRSDC